jgi:acetyl esterase/lipase
MMDFVEKFRGEPWLIYTDKDADAEATAKVWAELSVYRAKYPMVPGSEMVYLDDSTPEGVSREDYKAGNNNLFVYKDAAKHADEKRLIFYMHGGGFVRGNGKYCRTNAITQLKKIGLPVAACEYRTAPEFKEPCALQDVEECYNFVVNTLGYAPENIIFTGDSAGGALGLGLCNRFKAQGKALPAACVWISPSLDITLSLESHKANFGVDLCFPKGVAAVVPLYAPDSSHWKSPELSPYWGEFSGFPPTYFCVDDTEVFCCDSLETSAKMHKVGVKVRCHVTHGLWHTYPITWPAPPAADAEFEAIREFLGV